MAAFIAEMARIAWNAWAEIRAGRAAEEIKQDVRDRSDVAIDNAAAKRRLAARKNAEFR